MLDDIDSSKATGFDNAKIVEVCYDSCQPVHENISLIWKKLKISSFVLMQIWPSFLFLFFIIFYFFTNDRPVSALTSLRSLQWSDDRTLLCSFLSAFRWCFGCHHVLTKLTEESALDHDDVIKWKHFPRNWPFVRGIHRSRWIPHTKASDAELWCFLWSGSE